MGKSIKRKRPASDYEKNSRNVNWMDTDVDHVNNGLFEKESKDLDIDLIMNHKLIKDQVFYLVKLKAQTIKSSIWMPANKIMEHPSALYYHHVILNSSKGLDEPSINFFVKDVVMREPHDLLTLRRLCALLYSCTEEVVRELKLKFEELKAKALHLLSIPSHRLEKRRRHLLRLMRFAQERKVVLATNAEWEREINAVSTVPVCVENDVDLAVAPTDFRFIRDYESSYVDLTAEPAVCCACKDCFAEQDSCCAARWGGRFAYNAQGRLRLPPGHEVYECHAGCACGGGCVNRVVHRGPCTPLTVFRTRDGRGWGLRTEVALEQGQFVLEYLGEVITPVDAEVRDEAYDLTGATYLFDLSGGAFTVDAGQKGNASRFINHACDPNLQVYTVFGDQQDPTLPRLAFFTRRRVSPGEELTFDYKMDDRLADHDYLIAEKDRVPCRCGAHNCRKFLF